MNKALLEKRIGFTLPDNLLDDIPFEAGFPPVLKESFEKNQFFVDWGHSIIRAACAFDLYRNDQSITIEEINKKAKSACQYIESEIYRNYQLRDFVIKSNTGRGNFNPEITSKLLVMIFMQHGFLAVTTLLEPLFKHFHRSQKLDREGILEKYAKYRNQKLSYSTSYVSGRLDEKIYRCKISIGSQYAEGRGIGVNNAQTAAEINFIQKYDNSIEQFLSAQKSNKIGRAITEDRKKQVIDAVKLLNLNGKYLSFGQMDELLTHSSFSSIPKNQTAKNNMMLASLGHYILDILSYEYCYRHSMLSSPKHDEMILENNLALCLSENYLKYLLRTPYIISEDHKGGMKVEIFRGILASYWINYLIKEDEKISDCAKAFAQGKLAISDLINRTGYYTFAKEIAKIAGWNISEAAQKNQSNKTQFQSSITVSGVYWSQTGTGIAKSENSSRELASKDALSKIIRYCDNPDIAAAIQNKLAKPADDPVGLVPTAIPGTGGAKIGSKPRSTDSETSDEISFDRSENILYICKGTISCERKQHKIISAAGILTSLEGKPVKIDVQYCTSCKMYFINQDTYRDYRQKFGDLLGNFAFRNNNSAKGNGPDGWTDESVLKLCGYNVGKKNNLSEEKRRLILKNIMIRNILPKYRIEEYLEFFIRLNKDDRDKIMAVRKWKADLNWVRSFNIDQQRQFWIKEIRKARKS